MKIHRAICQAFLLACAASLDLPAQEAPSSGAASQETAEKAPEKAPEKTVRFGIIGCDTSHVIAFTKILHDDKAPDHVAGGRVILAFKGGSPDIEASIRRVDGFTRELNEKWGVEIVDSIPDLCARVDAVLLTSVDGRPHLEQARPVFAAKKPLFIDKPLAGTLADAREILRLARESGTPCFSASSLRFYPGVVKLRSHPGVGDILGANAFSPCPIEPHHPDLFWYGVHGVEILYALMGPGCERVTRIHTPGTDIAVGVWKDGRVGSFRGIRSGASVYGATAFGPKGAQLSDPVDGSLYRPLVEEILKFARTGKEPVPLEETVEMFAFMEAADESKRRGGPPVPLDTPPPAPPEK